MIEEKNFKKQQEFLTKLETKYEEICKTLGLNPDLKKIKEEIEENNKKNLMELKKFNDELNKIRKNSKQDAPKFVIDDMIRLKTEPNMKKKRYGSVKEYKDDKEEIIEPFDSKNLSVKNSKSDNLLFYFVEIKEKLRVPFKPNINFKENCTK